MQFYSALGLVFTKHSHGTGPEHYAAENAGAVLELYPLTDTQNPTNSVRLGFSVDSLEDVLVKLQTLESKTISQPKDSPWGRRAVVKDPDGHTVELVTRCR